MDASSTDNDQQREAGKPHAAVHPCPPWCTEPPNHDAVFLSSWNPADRPLHKGPRFGHLGIWGLGMELVDVVIDEVKVNEAKPQDVRQVLLELATDLSSAAAWIEAQQ